MVITLINLMGSKWTQYPSSHFSEDLTSIICVILLTKKQTDLRANGYGNNTSLLEVKTSLVLW